MTKKESKDSWLNAQRSHCTLQMSLQYSPAEGLGEILAKDARPPTLTQGQSEMVLPLVSHIARLRLHPVNELQGLKVAQARVAASRQARVKQAGHASKV